MRLAYQGICRTIAVIGHWEWSDLRSERSGGRPLPQAIRIALIVAAFAGGLVFGEIVQKAVDLIAYFDAAEEVR
jgi:hypothetical protein